MIISELFEAPQQCPKCGGISFSDLILAEKKDACYYKVKASAKVWPSAYASGRLVQCRKKGAGNYGNKSEGVMEMDKSQTPPGRDGSNDPDAGKKEYTAKTITPKKAAKDAVKILNKVLNKKPGVAEGTLDEAVGMMIKGAALNGLDDIELADQIAARTGGRVQGGSRGHHIVITYPTPQDRAIAAKKIRKMFPDIELYKTAGNRATIDEQGVAEVSNELRNRYVARASDDYGHANFAAKASKSHPGLDDYSKEQEQRANKRAAGLNRALSDKRLGKEQGVAEGALNELSKDTLKSYAKKAVPDMQASQKKSEIEAGKAASTKDDETAKTHHDAAKQAKDRTEKRMAGISGAIKRVTNQGVAEGELDEAHHGSLLDHNKGQFASVIFQSQWDTDPQIDYYNNLDDAKFDTENASAHHGSVYAWNGLRWVRKMSATERTGGSGFGNYGSWAENKQGVAEEQELNEKWSQKYKSSINCANPRGFSQKAHCAGRNKNEDVAEGVMYGAENLHVGDDVIVSGDVNLNGATGVIDSFGQDKRFVVVDLYNHGRHSFHSSDVSANDHDNDEHDDLDETRKGQVPMTLKPGETDNIEPEDSEGFKKLPAYKQGQQAQQSRGKDLIQQSPYTYQSDQDWAYRNGAFDQRQAAASADFAKRGPLTTAEGEQQKGADYRDPKEVDYDDEYDAMVARVKKLAGLGPMKTVYDPAKRVYRNMPTAQQPKK